MPLSKRHIHIWKSYSRSLEHVFQFNKHPRRTVAHISAHNAHTNHVGFLLLISIGALSLSWLVTRLPLFNQYSLSQQSFSLHQQISFLLVFYSIYLMTAIVALIIKNLFYKKLNPMGDLLILAWLIVCTTPYSLLYSPQTLLWASQITGCFLLLLLGKMIFKQYSFAGFNFYLASCVGIGVGVAWGVQFFVTMPVSTFTKALILCTSPLLFVRVPSAFLHMLEMYDILCREHWRKLRHEYPAKLKAYHPFVSIHIPTYSEPPELVMQTLNKIAIVDYKDYEVIVIDNNTKDPNLWKPVEEHCQRLGHKFRFIHADNIEGAKGGALNYIHQFIDKRTEIIAVIDADYQVDRGFLKALVGHFENPKVAFIQTPHDYRDWQDNLFLTMCYWEYKIFFHTVMISLNEHDAGITVGTMCLVRKEALEKAGGWSEWCVTEDSELAIRIHDQGFSSIYVDKTYGRGLIPDSFEGYKKQRYRWTAGPVQEFRHYFKHFLGLSGKESKFSLVQRIFHLNHGLANTLLAFNIPAILISVAIVGSMIYHHEIIRVPFELWIAATVTLLASPLLMFLLYRVTVRATVVEIVEQAIATKALSHVIVHAALRTALTGSAAWNRTSKFKSTQSYLAALFSTKEEISIGLSLLVFVVGAYIIFPYQGLSLMFLIGISYISLEYFAAPFMAIVGVWSFKKEAHSQLSSGDDPSLSHAL